MPKWREQPRSYKGHTPGAGGTSSETGEKRISQKEKIIGYIFDEYDGVRVIIKQMPEDRGDPVKDIMDKMFFDKSKDARELGLTGDYGKVEIDRVQRYMDYMISGKLHVHWIMDAPPGIPRAEVNRKKENIAPHVMVGRPVIERDASIKSRIQKLAKKVKKEKDKKKKVDGYKKKKYPGTKTDAYFMGGDMMVDSND